jgi:hypothetical protein
MVPQGRTSASHEQGGWLCRSQHEGACDWLCAQLSHDPAVNSFSMLPAWQTTYTWLQGSAPVLLPSWHGMHQRSTHHAPDQCRLPMLLLLLLLMVPLLPCRATTPAAWAPPRPSWAPSCPTATRRACGATLTVRDPTGQLARGALQALPLRAHTNNIPIFCYPPVCLLTVVCCAAVCPPLLWCADEVQDKTMPDQEVEGITCTLR